MRLNPDCIRDVLLTVEEISTPNHMVAFAPGIEHVSLSKYTHDEVYYHIQQCNMSGFLTKVFPELGGKIIVADLSPAGHNFLANVRADTNWNKTKEIAKKVGSTSLDAITQIAANVISNLISGNG